MKGLRKQMEAERQPEAQPVADDAAKLTAAEKRKAKRFLGGYFSPEMARRVGVLARNQGRTIQAFVGAALDAELERGGERGLGER